MFRSILRSTMMLAALLAAYQAYVLLAVPLMEPPLELQERKRITEDERNRAAGSVTKYQLLLSNYFPKDHWSQMRPPKVIASSNEQAMLVLDDYKRHENGRVDIDRFALLVFPTPPREGITPPRDTIILEAPQGARLVFDNFHPERGQIGQITRGQFPGRITIRSDMHEAGPEDDLVIETADLEMNTKLLYSNSPVRFRMGPNVGGGRELEIRLLVDEHTQRRDTGLKIGGIDSLEIRRDVRMRLQLETASLLPGGGKEPSTGYPGSHAPRGNPIPSRSGGDIAAPSTQSVAEVRSHAERGNEDKGRGGEKPKLPMEASCSGPFTFDFVRYVASMDRDVELRQMNPNGPSDQLSCSQLDIHFAPKALPNGETQAVVVDAGKRQQRDLGRLEPVAIVAEGHPVVVTSPARSAQARGDRIQIALRDQRVRVGGRDAMLVYGPNVLRAPEIEYQHPAMEAATAIGRFRASGPGSLRYLPDPAKPQQVFQTEWQTNIELGRENGQPVLTLEGRPQLAFADAGSLTADRIKIYLRELEGKSTAIGLPISGGAGGEKSQVTPDRLAATGRVEIQSAQLTGRTSELQVSFPIQRQAPEDKSKDAGGLAGRLGGDTAGTKQQAFHIDSDKMRMEVRLGEKSAAPATLACDGNVVFREVPLNATGEQPLEIRGGQLTVDRLDSSAPYITLRGVAPGETAGSKLAQLAGRGVTMLVDVVELDARDNRMWSAGPGKATLLVTRDLEGRAAAAPFPLEITWQGGLQFDGRMVIFERNVIVAGTDDKLRCDRLTARLTTPIQFGQGIDQRNIDLSEIECQGQVTIDHLSRDLGGVTSHERVNLGRLTINQQTGAISGEGPGVIRSTQFGEGLGAMAIRPGAAQKQSAAPPDAAKSKLHFLRVDFRRGLAGNLYTRELTFSEQVRCVYGPVDAWEQELDLKQPESLPPEAITLSCDELRINEDPVAARAMANAPGSENRPIGPIQLQASSNVRIEGQTPSQGQFGAQADRASYEQADKTFVLEGSGRSPARLWIRRFPGEAVKPLSAGKIRYNIETGMPKVEGFQFLEFTPEDIESARRPTPTR